MASRTGATGAINVLLVAVIAAAVTGLGAGAVAGLATRDDSTTPAVGATSTAVGEVSVSLCPNGDPIGTLHANDRVFVVGRDRASSWLQLRDPSNVANRVWVRASAVHADTALTKVKFASCPRALSPSTTTEPPLPKSSTTTTATTVPGETTTVGPTATTTPSRTTGPTTKPSNPTAPTTPPKTTPPDTTNPTVTAVVAKPSTITENDNVVCHSAVKTSEISASASDASGIASVSVRWSINGHSGQVSASLSGGKYSASIGPFATDVVPYPTASGVINVAVRATDNHGNVGQATTKVTLNDCTFI